MPACPPARLRQGTVPTGQSRLAAVTPPAIGVFCSVISQAREKFAAEGPSTTTGVRRGRLTDSDFRRFGVKVTAALSENCFRPSVCPRRNTCPAIAAHHHRPQMRDLHRRRVPATRSLSSSKWLRPMKEKSSALAEWRSDAKTEDRIDDYR